MGQQGGLAAGHGKDLFDFIWFGVRLAGPEKYCLFYV